MGAQLVAAAVSTALPNLLSDRSRVLLLVMALMAHDTDPQPAYFGGSDHLASRLGYGHPATCNGCSRRRDGKPRPSCDPAGERAVRRGLAELEAAGLIRQPTDESGNKVGNRHHNRRWQLTLAPRTAPVDNRDAPVPGERTPPSAPESTPQSGRDDQGGHTGPVVSGHHSPHQRNHLEEPPTEETHPRLTPTLATSTTDRAREAAKREPRGKVDCRMAVAAARAENHPDERTAPNSA